MLTHVKDKEEIEVRLLHRNIFKTFIGHIK